MLSPDEGCWIGSSAKVMPLVLSEAAASQHVPSRPFRINAGPVHSYVSMADNSTKYLSELEPGDQVLVYNSLEGTCRSFAVGRLKEEIRPCVLIKIETADGHEGQLFLQPAETFRLGQMGGIFLLASDLESQSSITSHQDLTKYPLLVRTTLAGTHLGKAYTGFVKER